MGEIRPIHCGRLTCQFIILLLPYSFLAVRPPLTLNTKESETVTFFVEEGKIIEEISHPFYVDDKKVEVLGVSHLIPK